jgi:O-acetylserine/cysteine efflux transporter
MVLMALVPLAWGLNTIAVKIATLHMPPILLAGLRFALLALVLVPLIRWRPGRMGRITAFAMASGVAHFTLVFISASLTDDMAMVAVLSQLGAPMATLMSVFVLKERLGWQRGLGLLAAFAGAVIISWRPGLGGDVLAASLIVLSCVALAVGIMIARRLQDVPALALQGWMAVLSFPVMFALSGLFESGQVAAVQGAPIAAWTAIAFTVAGASIVGHGSLFFLLARYPVAMVMPFTLLTPIVAVIAAVVFLGNTITLQFLVGTVVTMLGLAGVVLANNRR